jgi:hypothetical protein
MVWQRGLWLVAALWWGSLTALGAWVVPLLFAHAPTKAVAAGLAVNLFSAQAWVALVCGVLSLWAQRYMDHVRGLAHVPSALILVAMLRAWKKAVWAGSRPVGPFSILHPFGAMTPALAAAGLRFVSLAFLALPPAGPSPGVRVYVYAR